MRFTRLRLTGFKSFVDPAELVITEGLTGIVGPNGCGKSNLVEALRWVMGESSAKNLRGGGMEDVIFAGAASRPARAAAEVALLIDNGERRAPPAFNDSDEIEVVRRIARDAGSTYRINGREVRARDVQLLFTDAASGAHSPAMVRQGEIGALIAAKPRERRAILEEAAGTAGLHARRHEAELRLSAAEANLARLGDLLQQLESRLAALRRQARQAVRYREVAERLRRQEALLLHLRWRAVTGAEALAVAALAAAESRLAAAARETSAAQAALLAARERLAPLRQAEAEASGVFQRLGLERERLEAEARRIAEQRARAERLLREIAQDAARAEALASDARMARDRLAAEQEAMQAACRDEAQAMAAAEAEVTAAGTALREAEARLDAANGARAQHAARRESALRELREIARRRARLEQDMAALAGERARLEAEVQCGTAVTELAAASARAQAEAEAAAERAAGAETARLAAERAEAAARETLHAAEREAAPLAAERKALGDLLHDGTGGRWPPLLDALRVVPGYETALGAALGEDLQVPLDEAAPVHWAHLPQAAADPDLPAGVLPLAAVVEAPPALARRLAQIGVVARAEGPRLRRILAPGQRLVSREGDLWRWDGLTAAAEAPSAAARRLAQRNRLGVVEEDLATASRRIAAAQGRAEAARAKTAAALATEKTARQAARAAEQALAAARQAEAKAVQQNSARAGRLSALDEAAARQAQDLALLRAEEDRAQAALAALAPLEAQESEIVALRGALGACRSALAKAESARAGLTREAAARRQRLEAIARDMAAWRERLAQAEAQARTLQERQAIAEAEREAAASAPEDHTARRQEIAQAMHQAEARRRAAGEAAAAAARARAAAERAHEAAQEALGAAREERARAEANQAAARARRADLARLIGEQLGCRPEELPALAGSSADSALPEETEVEAELGRLRQMREAMGAVNLRAEEEMAALTAERDGLDAERRDLEAAIARLRQAIASLNREGRERLLAAFAAVNGHFVRLFTHLFGGGEARLELTAAEDPFVAGLEIMARPPGKRLQLLSLLSGGEQALSALALIFAVFLTRPAPICVLDEVDAPLDGANVGRFCALLDEMTRLTATRFLVITHNPVTMARMDRLYGVTMAERGVSQLVSVDLAQAGSRRAAE